MDTHDWASMIADSTMEEHRATIARMADHGRWTAAYTQLVVEAASKELATRLT